ncbi:hypothetical protein V8E36_002809 [Tilletia maclaganii]
MRLVGSPRVQHSRTLLLAVVLTLLVISTSSASPALKSLASSNQLIQRHFDELLNFHGNSSDS